MQGLPVTPISSEQAGRQTLPSLVQTYCAMPHDAARKLVLATPG
jgi:hypothetical protein